MRRGHRERHREFTADTAERATARNSEGGRFMSRLLQELQKKALDRVMSEEDPTLMSVQSCYANSCIGTGSPTDPPETLPE